MRRHLVELLAKIVVLSILIASIVSPARAEGLCPATMPAGVWCAERVCYVPRSVYRALTLRERACGLAALAARGMTHRVVADRR